VSFSTEGEIVSPLTEARRARRVRGKTPRLLTQTPFYERGIDRTEKGVKQPSHMERDAPLTITSPLGGED